MFGEWASNFVAYGLRGFQASVGAAGRVLYVLHLELYIEYQ